MTNDAYWEWVDELPPEFKSEEEYRKMVAQEACEEIFEYNDCQHCEFKKSCDLREKLIEFKKGEESDVE